MLHDVLDQRVLCVEDQSLPFLGELIQSHGHAGSGVHLHHIRHSAALLVDREHGGCLLVSEILELYAQLVVLHRLADHLLKLFGRLLEGLCRFLARAGLERFLDIRVDSGKVKSLVLGFQLLDERLVNGMVQDKGLHLVVAEHADVLALLLRIRHIVDRVIFDFFLFLVGLAAVLVDDFRLYLLSVLIGSGLCALLFLFRLGIHLVDLEGLGGGEIFSVQILEQDIVGHSGAELVVSEAPVLDEGRDVIPVLLVIFFVGLAHAGQLVRDLLGDIVADLFGKAVVLQRASGDVQRQVGAVDDALEQHQVLGNDFLDVVRDEDLVVVELDHTFGGLILQVQLGEVQDALEVVGIVHVEVDPEQGLLVISEDVSVEFLVLLFRALAGILAPERMRVVEQNRASSDLESLLRWLLAVLFLLGFDDLDHHVVGPSLGLGDRLGSARVLLGEIDLRRHEGAVLLDHFLRLIIVCELDAVFCQVKCDGRAKRLPASLVHGIRAAAVALPVYRLRAFLIRERIDGHHVSDHERTVEAQSEVADDLVAACLVFIFSKESFRAGKRDVVDVLLDLVRGHSDTVVRHLDGLVGGADFDVDPRLVIFRQRKRAHHIQLFELCDGIAAVGDQLSVENIVIAVQPFLDNGEHILTVNGQRSFFCHNTLLFYL